MLLHSVSVQTEAALFQNSFSFPDNFFDMIILGFCLYLCDRNKLFKIASEVDRVLKENSYLVIIDFYPGSFYYKNNKKK